LRWILTIHSSSLESCGVWVASQLEISLLFFQPLGRRHSKAAKEGRFHGHASLPATCIFIKAASFGGKNSEAGLQKLCKAMSDIHRRVVKRALLQASCRVVDPEKARQGLLSFKSRKLETKKKKAFISKGGGLFVSIASKRKRECLGF
jgi:hypothetical protein